MSSQPEKKDRKVSFSDAGDKVLLIPLLTDAEKEEFFYSGDDIKRMKDEALLEDTGITEEDISAKGKDLFEVRRGNFKRESLQRVAREISPMRSPPSQKKRAQQVDLGDSLSNLPEHEAVTKPEPNTQPERGGRPVRERRPRGEERGVRRCKSGMGPSRTDSLASRTNEGRTLRRGAPQRARSSMATGGGGMSDLAKMRAASRKIGASQAES